MTIFHYIEILKLDQAIIAGLRNRDFIQLEKKLNSKALFNKSIDKAKISGFIKTLKYNQREIETFYRPPFYGLRKILMNPERSHTFEVKKYITPFITDKLIQFINQNFSNEIENYTNFCIENNNLGSINSLLVYKPVLSSSISIKIEQYLNSNLKQIEFFLNGILNIDSEKLERIKNKKLFGSLSKLQNPEIDKSILSIQELIKYKLINRSYNNSVLTIASSLNSYETENVAINENQKSINDFHEKILKEESTANKKISIPKQSNYNPSRNYDKGYRTSKGDWKIVLSIILMLITIIRFCARNNSSSTRTTNYYEEQKELYQAPSYEITNLQKKLIYIHTTKEITNTQKEEFNYSRMKFISKYDKFPLPGAHTLVKNTTNKKVVFFYNNDFGGFKYKLLEPKSEVTVTFRYQHFLVFRGDDTYYTVYTDEYGESKVGIMFNEFDDSDLDLLKTLYTNDFQKQRKQSEIIISENGVEINEKS